MIDFNPLSHFIRAMPLPTWERGIPLALALIAGSSAAAYYYFSSDNTGDNSEYWEERKWIPKAVQDTVDPFLLPYNHPARKTLDEIYRSDSEMHGCTIINCGQVANVMSHPKLTEKSLIIKEVSSSPCWAISQKSVLKRVQGHRAANTFIEEQNFTHVKATQNWLYPRPENGTPLDWSIHYLTRPVRITLKILGMKCPHWLKIADKVFYQFIVVEEFVKIRRPNKEQFKNGENALIDEFIQVALEVGFNDTHEGNYCFDEEGHLVLFDLEDYSQDKEKRQAQGKRGIEIMFDGEEWSKFIAQKQYLSFVK